jgi:hypothetical protein
VWRLDRHTLAKHEILRPYLRAWFPIMSKYNGWLVFFDGSAGPGSYEKEEPGSPLMPPCEGGEEATPRAYRLVASSSFGAERRAMRNV